MRSKPCFNARAGTGEGDYAIGRPELAAPEHTARYREAWRCTCDDLQHRAQRFHACCQPLDGLLRALVVLHSNVRAHVDVAL